MIARHAEQYLAPSKSNEILKQITKLNAKKFEHKLEEARKKPEPGDISNYSKLTDLAYQSLSIIEEAIAYFGDVRNPLFFSKITSSAGRLLQNFRQMYGLIRSLVPVFNFIPPQEFSFLTEVNLILGKKMTEFHTKLQANRQEEVEMLFLQAYEEFLKYYDLFEANKRQYNFGKAQQNITPMESRVPLFAKRGVVASVSASISKPLGRKRGRLPGTKVILKAKEISKKQLLAYFDLESIADVRKKHKGLTAGKSADEIYEQLRIEHDALEKAKEEAVKEAPPLEGEEEEEEEEEGSVSSYEEEPPPEAGMTTDEYEEFLRYLEE